MPRTRPVPPTPRETYHHGNLKRALIDEALLILAEVAPEAFTLREAARRVGVDHRAAYRHFEDREALLAAVAAEGYRTMAASVRRALGRMAAESQTARLRCVMRTCVLFAASKPAYYRVMTGPRLNESGRFPELEPVIRQAFLVLEEEIAEGVRAGELEPLDTADTAIALWAVTSGIASLLLTRRIRIKPAKVPAYVDGLIDRALFGVARRSS